MSDASPFQRLRSPCPSPVRLSYEGSEVGATAGDNVAVALLAAGVDAIRETPVSGAPRGPFCMMGACFECLVEIDGEENVQACMTLVRDGMSIRRQCGVRRIGDAVSSMGAGGAADD